MENNLIIIDDNNLNSKLEQNYQVIWMTKKEAINHFNKTKKAHFNSFTEAKWAYNF